MIVVSLAPTAMAQDEAGDGDSNAPPTLAPPMSVEGRDTSFDNGDQITLSWNLSADDRPLTEEEEEAGQIKPVLFYRVERSSEQNGVYEIIGRAEPTKWDYKRGRMEFTVAKCRRNEDYFFQVTAIGPGNTRSETIGPIGPFVAHREWFDKSRFWLCVITVILCGSVVFFIEFARRGKPLKIRTIAGLEAVDEAVGRATEMGRPCLFIPGIQDMNDIQTIAGINILSRVSKTAAEYDAKVEVPTSRSLVMTTARETVHASYLAAGRPDAFNEDLIYYVTDEQFGYVAYLSGMMVRKKPAACFYMGSFFAESLILAETGNSIGAIQVAGTAQPAQLPFFVAACDYTLIGEELFAASAYLSGSPEELGSLKGQDVGKLIVALGLVVGVAVATLWTITNNDVFDAALQFIRETMLT